MTDPAARTPDVDTLAETVRESHRKAMEALGADVHPYSASAIRDWEQTLDAALSDLAAAARQYETMDSEYHELWHAETDRAEAAEADRDRLRGQVEDFDKRFSAALDREAGTQDALDEMRERVAELEDALRGFVEFCETLAAEEGSPIFTLYEQARAALAGDGDEGGA